MKRKPTDNQVEEMLARHLHREPAQFDFQKWAQTFPEEARQAEAGFAPAASNRSNQRTQVWRRIMTSRYTRYSGIAAALLVAFSFLFPGGNGIVPASIAWADVQKAIEEQQQARVTGVRNCFFGDEEKPSHKLTVEKLFSLSYGYADRTYTEDGTLIIQFTAHLPSGTMTVLFPTVKKYYRVKMPAPSLERVQSMDRDDFFEWLWASGDYRKVGPKEVQGIEAVGFEVDDLVDRFLGADGLGVSSKIVNFFFSMRSMTVRMWVDPERRLPIQVEGEGEINPCLVTGYRKMKLTEINDHWDFDVDLAENLFDPEIPEDYEQLGVPGVVKAGAALYSIGIASIPIVLIGVRRSNRKR